MTFEAKEAITAGIMGGIIAAIISMALVHFVVPFPETVGQNTIGHGITGLLSGLFSGAIGVTVALKKFNRVKES